MDVKGRAILHIRAGLAAVVLVVNPCTTREPVSLRPSAASDLRPPATRSPPRVWVCQGPRAQDSGLLLPALVSAQQAAGHGLPILDHHVPSLMKQGWQEQVHPESGCPGAGPAWCGQELGKARCTSCQGRATEGLRLLSFVAASPQPHPRTGRGPRGTWGECTCVGGRQALCAPIQGPQPPRLLPSPWEGGAWGRKTQCGLQQAMSSSLQWIEGTHRLEEPVSKTTVKHCGGVPMPISP